MTIREFAVILNILTDAGFGDTVIEIEDTYQRKEECAKNSEVLGN